MGLCRGVQDAIWEVLAPHIDAVQIALRAAGCDVTPVLLLVDLPQARKPVEDANLRNTTRLHTEHVVANIAHTQCQPQQDMYLKFS